MRLYACFDRFTKFGRVSWLLSKAFREKSDALKYAEKNPGMIMKVFEEVRE